MSFVTQRAGTEDVRCDNTLGKGSTHLSFLSGWCGVNSLTTHHTLTMKVKGYLISDTTFLGGHIWHRGFHCITFVGIQHQE